MSVHAEQCRCVCARGQTPDEKEALAAIKEAYDLGINFWDVAPFYGGGSAERVPPAASPLPRERVAPPPPHAHWPDRLEGAAEDCPGCKPAAPLLLQGAMCMAGVTASLLLRLLGLPAVALTS